ncbi:hypothetical protein PT2222_310070 [Paraburkholderia tropica]
MVRGQRGGLRREAPWDAPAGLGRDRMVAIEAGRRRRRGTSETQAMRAFPSNCGSKDY